VKLEGRAVVIARDNVDTDVLYPGPYLNVTDVETMKLYLFEGLEPSLRQELGGDTALVVGDNFGPGSSREHVPQAMKAWGVQFLVGRSFARIFGRNWLNPGLPIVTCPAAVDTAKPGSTRRLDVQAGSLEVDGTSFDVPPPRRSSAS
jgi:3-isopropylmalate/(R)-2-methylmalate dehydratase small subunit